MKTEPSVASRPASNLSSTSLPILGYPTNLVKRMESPNRLDMLERHPDLVSGAWVFKGTRVPVAALFENLKDGASIDQFLAWFPGVPRTQVEALLNAPRSPLLNLYPHLSHKKLLKKGWTDPMLQV